MIVLFSQKKKKKYVNGHLIIIRLDVPLEKEEEKIFKKKNSERRRKRKESIALYDIR